MSSTTYEYRATITRVLDGDTMDVDVDLGFSITAHKRIRLYGINAPEIHSKDPHEKAMGVAAWNELAKLCEGQRVVIRTAKPAETEKYGRWLARVYLESGADVVQAMLDSKLVKPWDGTGARPI